MRFLVAEQDEGTGEATLRLISCTGDGNQLGRVVQVLGLWGEPVHMLGDVGLGAEDELVLHILQDAGHRRLVCHTLSISI